MPLPPSRLRSSARSRLFCCRVVSGDSEPPVDGPMLPVVPDTPSPGCGRPSSEPVRARGMVLPAVTSLVEGESEPDGAAAAPGAGPAPVVAEPVAPGAAEPAAPAAPEFAAPEDAPPPAPPDELPPEDWASAAAPPKASEAASASGMMVRDMGRPSWRANAKAGLGFGSEHDRLVQCLTIKESGSVRRAALKRKRGSPLRTAPPM